jgi:hypothetical protein
MWLSLKALYCGEWEMSSEILRFLLFQSVINLHFVHNLILKTLQSNLESDLFKFETKADGHLIFTLK